MYMLEGISRWNMGRAKEAVDVEGASTLRSFDVRLISLLNNLSQRVHGCALVPEFTPPGKPTGKKDLRATLLNLSITSPPPFFNYPSHSEDMHFLNVKIVLFMYDIDVCIYVLASSLCLYWLQASA